MKCRRILKYVLKMYKVFYLYSKYSKAKSERGKRNRRWWVRPNNLDRDACGFYYKVFKKIKSTDPEEFFAQTRMNQHTYDLLLTLIGDQLRKRSIRRPISVECRLAVTLSYVRMRLLSIVFENNHIIITGTCLKV